MDNHNLYQHQDIFGVLNKRLLDFKDGYRQNVALLGEELIGKTTLLKTFLDNIGEEYFIPVYVDIPSSEFSLFCKRFLNNLLYNLLKRSQLLSARESLEVLVKRSKEILPLSTPALEQFLLKIEKDKPEILLKDLFGLMDSIAAETKKKLILIFDEFHHLKKLGGKNICQELGKKIMFGKNALFIFCSSSQREAKEILGNDLALLFGNFETIELKMLNASQCETLIREHLRPITINKEFTDFLINFTGGHPFYLRIICEEAAHQCHLLQKSILEKEILIQTLQYLLFYDWGIFNLRFMGFLSQGTSGRNKNDLLHILDALAIGKNRLKDLTSYLKKQKKEVAQKLNRLIEMDILSRNGSFYSINDRLFCFWLKFVHFEKSNSLNPDYLEQALHFRSQINAEIEEFMRASGQNIADRMVDLFHLFEGDSVLFERKKFQLSPFKELKIMRFEEADLKFGILGKSQDSLLLAAIKEEGLKEQDINKFLEIAKGFKHKTIHKVMVSLGEIEHSAKLLAKTSQIATWDLGHLNTLLDLYNKPRIIKR